jgi:hypothetical protein
MDNANPKNKIFTMILLLIIILLFSGCLNIKCSYISDEELSNGWYENLSLRNSGLHFLGLEKWCSSTYEIKGKYPSSLIVNTLKTLFLEDENNLYLTIQNILINNFSDRISINESSEFSGQRTLLNSHKSKYLIYEGIDREKGLKIKLIGEIWNCGVSGTSIVCIGITYISNEKNQSIMNYINWQKIIEDPDGNIENFIGLNGLIYNTKCH